MLVLGIFWLLIDYQNLIFSWLGSKGFKEVAPFICNLSGPQLRNRISPVVDNLLVIIQMKKEDNYITQQSKFINVEELPGTVTYTSIIFTKIKMYFSNKNCNIEKCTIKIYKAPTCFEYFDF